MWHVFPETDTNYHIDNSTCHCAPSVQVLENGDLMVVHNAFSETDQKWIAAEEFIFEKTQ